MNKTIYVVSPLSSNYQFFFDDKYDLIYVWKSDYDSNYNDDTKGLLQKLEINAISAKYSDGRFTAKIIEKLLQLKVNKREFELLEKYD